MRQRIPDARFRYTRPMRSVTSWLGPLVLLVVVLRCGDLAGADGSNLGSRSFRSPAKTSRPKRSASITARSRSRPTMASGCACGMPRADAAAQVVYFHGNGGNLSLWADVLVGFWHQGLRRDRRRLSRLRPEHRQAFGTGPLSRRRCDASLCRRQPARPDVPLIYWGRSLGTVMAAYAASRRAPSGIVLEAGFPSMRSVLETNPVMWVLSWVSSYRMSDRRVDGERQSAHARPARRPRQRHPLSPGAAPLRISAGPKTFVTIPGGDHNEPVPPDARGLLARNQNLRTNLRNQTCR